MVKACNAFCVLILSSLLAAAQMSVSAEESKLIALENAWNQAQLQHDVRALEGLVDANFVYTDTDGTVMDKAQFLDDIQNPDYKMSQVVNDEIKVHNYKDVAVVFGRYHAKGSYKGKSFDHWGRFTDTWVFRNSTWVCVASHTNRIEK
jgi:ketosteroid isomerase-like protein